MSSPQTSRATNARALSFTGVLEEALSSAGHNITWTSPDIDWTREDLDQFDSIILGMVPLTSIAANRVYGALNVLSLADPNKLTLLLDAPEPSLLAASLRATLNAPEKLVKPFYAKRQGFDKASEPETLARLVKAVEGLVNGMWPPTIIPATPWRSTTYLSAMPSGLAGSAEAVNLDIHLIEDLAPYRTPREDVYDKWAVDSGWSRWTERIRNGVVSDMEYLPTGRDRTDEALIKVIQSSSGVLIPPHQRGGGWWSPVFAYAMNCRVPIATEWRESSVLGASWSQLPARIEALAPALQTALAEEQRAVYLENIPSRLEVEETLNRILFRTGESDE